MHTHPLRRLAFTLTGLTLLLAACVPQVVEITATPRPTRPGGLTPYTDPTVTATPSPGQPDTPTPLPSATPTPRSHTVRKGEDMFGIALRYGVPLDELMAANPEIDPRWMSVGAVLVIPAAQHTPTPDPSNPPQPTPVGLEVQPPDCYPSGEGGLWCFVRAENPQGFSVEGVAVNLRLLDRESGQILEQSAYPPLNLLPPGGFLPLAAYFPPPAPRSFDATAELISALPVPPESGRYLEVTPEDVRVEIDEDGLSARVSGTLRLAGGEVPAQKVYAVAAAFDAAGRIVGLRRWEGAELAAGESQPFELLVFTAGPLIASVTVLAEGIP
jgi:LysM repeat protein